MGEGFGAAGLAFAGGTTVSAARVSTPSNCRRPGHPLVRQRRSRPAIGPDPIGEAADEAAVEENGNGERQQGRGGQPVQHPRRRST
jgi:hypothetical protein